MTLMKVHGRCHCGKIRYEAQIDPAKVNICHCADCQMLSGTGYRVSVPAAAGRFRLLSGTPKVYVKTADSGTKRRHSFCADCGAPVHSAADSEAPPFYSLRIGCLEERAALPPRQRIWNRSAVPWSQDLGHVPAIEHQ